MKKTYILDILVRLESVLQLLPPVDGGLNLRVELLIALLGPNASLFSLHLFDGCVESSIDRIAIVLIIFSLLFQMLLARVDGLGQTPLESVS